MDPNFLKFQVNDDGSKLWVHKYDPVFLKIQVYVNGSKFWVHTFNPDFFKVKFIFMDPNFGSIHITQFFQKNQVHLYRPQFWIHIPI